MEMFQEFRYMTKWVDEGRRESENGSECEWHPNRMHNFHTSYLLRRCELWVVGGGNGGDATTNIRAAKNMNGICLFSNTMRGSCSFVNCLVKFSHIHLCTSRVALSFRRLKNFSSRRDRTQTQCGDIYRHNRMHKHIGVHSPAQIEWQHPLNANGEMIINSNDAERRQHWWDVATSSENEN